MTVTPFPSKLFVAHCANGEVHLTTHQLSEVAKLYFQSGPACALDSQGCGPHILRQYAYFSTLTKEGFSWRVSHQVAGDFGKDTVRQEHISAVVDALAEVAKLAVPPVPPPAQPGQRFRNIAGSLE